jgi:hypothetical protein
MGRIGIVFEHLRDYWPPTFSIDLRRRAFELGTRGLCLGCDRDIGAVASDARDRDPDAA